MLEPCKANALHALHLLDYLIFKSGHLQLIYLLVVYIYEYKSSSVRTANIECEERLTVLDKISAVSMNMRASRRSIFTELRKSNGTHEEGDSQQNLWVIKNLHYSQFELLTDKIGGIEMPSSNEQGIQAAYNTGNTDHDGWNQDHCCCRSGNWNENYL